MVGNVLDDDGYESDTSVVSRPRSESYITDPLRTVNYFVGDEREEAAIPEYEHSPDMSQLRTLMASLPRKKSTHHDSGIGIESLGAPTFEVPADTPKPRRSAGRRYSGPL